MSGNIDVLIIAHNEALNLGHCLESLQGWVRKIHVIDSGSTDGTQELGIHDGELCIMIERDTPDKKLGLNMLISILWTLVLMPMIRHPKHGKN